MTIIETLLIENGPLLSGDLVRLLEQTAGLSNEAARQQLSRTKFPVKKLTGFLANNQSFVYLNEHLEDGTYTEQLLLALGKSAKRLYVALKALEYNKGYLAHAELPAYMFSPVNNLKGHRRADAVLDQLLRLDLIKIEGDLYKLNPVHFPRVKMNFQFYKAIDIARRFLLLQFTDWAKMIGLVSFDTPVLFREFSKLQWAFTAPSYVGTLTRSAEGVTKPAFIVADILVGNDINEDNIYFFIEKIKILKAINKNTNIIPFLIVDTVPREAFKVLKQFGVVVGLIAKMFGAGYTDLIKDLINTVVNAGAILKKNPDRFIELMEKIEVLTDGKTNNLRGDVFELTVGYYHARKCKTLDIGKKIYVEARPYELDVFAVYPDHITVAECKGMKRPVTLQEVDQWLVKINDVRKHIETQEAYNNKKHVFEYWSTSGFDTDAQTKINLAVKAKKFECLFFDQAAIIAKAKEIPGKKFTEILNQYFVREPL